MNGNVSRRKVSLGAAAIGLGGFAVSRVAAAQVATPAATPAGVGPILGFVSLRVRQLAAPEFRTAVNDIVTSEFVPDVQALPGYQGYVLGDVLDDETQSLSVVVFEEAAQAEAFAELAQAFVGGLDPEFSVETPLAVEGDLLVTASAGSAEATPVASGTAAGYIAVRVYASLPGSNPRDMAPIVSEGFVPIVAGFSGFQGYLYFPSEGGFTSISLFDSEASALESTTAARGWVAENLTEFTAGDPQVINAAGVFIDLPVLAS